MKICFEERFERDLRKIKDKRVLKRVEESIKKVRIANDMRETRNFEKLKEYNTFYRIRIGNYRVGVELIDDKIIFTRFLHRKDIYKYFP
ncbi:MAG: type II toxin-antitoxin system RelE/ParE family toxin [bacterium]|nr:type II toxin-antitoxin system RelE/ParE family toxin [bacterium]